MLLKSNLISALITLSISYLAIVLAQPVDATPVTSIDAAAATDISSSNAIHNLQVMLRKVELHGHRPDLPDKLSVKIAFHPKPPKTYESYAQITAVQEGSKAPLPVFLRCERDDGRHVTLRSGEFVHPNKEIPLPGGAELDFRQAMLALPLDGNIMDAYMSIDLGETDDRIQYLYDFNSFRMSNVSAILNPVASS